MEGVGPGDVGDTLTYEGRKLQRLDSPHNRRHVSVFVELTISRYVYGTREIDGVEVNAKEQIFSWFSEQVKLRNPKGRKKVVCVMDGERALWKMLLASVSGVVCILDLFHVLERLWQAAHCFHAKGSDAAREFVSDRLSETEPAVHVL